MIMTDTTANLWNIPTIGTPQIWPIIQDPKNMEEPDVAMFDNAPHDVSMWSFFGKIFVSLVVWICMVALLFWALAAIGSMINADSEDLTTKIIIAVIWFIVHFVWSSFLALMFNIFFSKRYYAYSKMFALIFVSSLIFFAFFLIMYFLYNKVENYYILLWYQVIFWLYITLNLIDFLSQPNYCASSMLWNTLWCIITIVVYIVILVKLFPNPGTSDYVYIALLPVILAYTLMIFGSELWNAIYYKFYEWWNNPFYLPSLNELREKRRKEELKQEEEEEVNVDMK